MKQAERQSEFGNDRLQLPVDREPGISAIARHADILPPFAKALAALIHRSGILIGHVVHLPAESIEGAHRGSFGPGEHDERQRQVGGTPLGDLFADFGTHARGVWVPSSRMGGNPPVLARVSGGGRRG